MLTVTPAQAGIAYLQNASTVTLFNTLTNTVDTVISAGGKENNGEILSPDGNYLYVLHSSSLNVAVISTATNQVVNYIQLPATALQPGDLALSTDGKTLYVDFSSGIFLAIDAQTGKVIATQRIGGVYPASIAVSPSGNLFYIASNQSQYTGILTTFSTATNAGTGQIITPLAPFPGSLAITPDTTGLYIGSGVNVEEASTVTAKIKSTFFAGFSIGFAGPMLVGPDGKYLYVAVTNFGITGLVQVFNTSNNSLLTTISLNTYYPTGLCLSPDGSLLYVTCTSPNSVVIINTKTNTIVAKIPVNNPPSIGINCIKPGGCIGSPITFTITVVPAPLPVIATSTDSLNSLTTTYGTPSTSESFTVSGANMRTGILITAPRGFEISLDNTNFSAKVTAGGPGLLSNITIYLRMPGTNGAGSYNGIIVLSSAGTNNVNIIIAKSMVRPAPLTITADNKTKAYGAPNPVLTLTYNGFENNDGPAQLIFPPVVSTTAALLSPPGNYPITVSNAFSSDYTMAYVPGILTITPDIIIPNAFTPNGDGINDTWDIQKIGDYPNCTVQVFNRFGEIVFSSIGYGTPRNGTYKGALLPQGTYYYIINLKNDVAVLSGYVVIVR